MAGEVLPDDIIRAITNIKLDAAEQTALKAAITAYISAQKVPTSGTKEALLATPPTKTALELEKEELKAGMQKFEAHKSPMGLDVDSKFMDLFQQAIKTMQQVGTKPMEFVQSFTGLLQLEGQLANFLSAIAEGTFADEDVRKMVANGLKSYITAYIGKMILDKEGNLLTEVAKNDMPGNATAILQKVRDQIATARTAPTLTPKKAPAAPHPDAAEAAQHSGKAAAHVADAIKQVSKIDNHKENHPEHETHIEAAGKSSQISKGHADNALNAVSPEHAKTLSSAAASAAEAAGHSAKAAVAPNAEAAAPHVEAAAKATAEAEGHAASAVAIAADHAKAAAPETPAAPTETGPTAPAAAPAAAPTETGPAAPAAPAAAPTETGPTAPATAPAAAPTETAPAAPVVVQGTIVPELKSATARAYENVKNVDVKAGLTSAASNATSLASRGIAALGLPFQKKDAAPAELASLESLQAAHAQTQVASARKAELEGATTKKQKVELAKKHADEDVAASAAKTAKLNEDLKKATTAQEFAQKQAELAAHEAIAAEHKTALDSATRNEARVKGSYLNALGMNAVDAAKSAKRGVGAVGSTLAAPVTSLKKNANALDAFNAANGIVGLATSQFNMKYRQKTPEEEARLQAEEEEELKESDTAEKIHILERKVKTNIKDIGDIQRHLKNLEAKKTKAEAANEALPDDKKTDISPFEQQIDMVGETLKRAKVEKEKLNAKLTAYNVGGTRRRRPRGSTRKRARKKKQKKRPRRRATGRKRRSRQTAKGRTYFTADDHFF
jgi:hypothetical protein